MDFFQYDGRLLRRYREQFAELNIQLLSENYPQKGFNPKCLTERDYALIDKLIAYVEAGTGYVFVAKDGERICGYCHVYFRQFLDEKRLFIDALIVHPDFRHQGKLLEQAIFLPRRMIAMYLNFSRAVMISLQEVSICQTAFPTSGCI